MHSDQASRKLNKIAIFESVQFRPRAHRQVGKSQIRFLPNFEFLLPPSQLWVQPSKYQQRVNFRLVVLYFARMGRKVLNQTFLRTTWITLMGLLMRLLIRIHQMKTQSQMTTIIPNEWHLSSEQNNLIGNNSNRQTRVTCNPI